MHDFIRLYEDAPKSIHASTGFGPGAKVTFLNKKKGEGDSVPEEHWKHNVIKGDGHHTSPFAFYYANGHSRHLQVLYLWYRYRPEQKRSDGKIFIQVGPWVFALTKKGVISTDGQLTELKH